jgi:hypothetical protein
MVTMQQKRLTPLVVFRAPDEIYSRGVVVLETVEVIDRGNILRSIRPASDARYSHCIVMLFIQACPGCWFQQGIRP